MTACWQLGAQEKRAGPTRMARPCPNTGGEKALVRRAKRRFLEIASARTGNLGRWALLSISAFRGKQGITPESRHQYDFCGGYRIHGQSGLERLV
jgi:hypothetical protein